jgi:hypothetical protein
MIKLKKLSQPNMTIPDALIIAEKVSQQEMPTNPQEIIVKGALLTLANFIIDAINDQGE